MLPRASWRAPTGFIEELARYLENVDEVVVSVPDNGEWTERMVRELKRELVKYPGARAVGDHAAERTGELVRLTDIAQWARIAKQQISNDLSGMSKATRRLFGAKKWPFRAVVTGQGMHYLMQSEIA